MELSLWMSCMLKWSTHGRPTSQAAGLMGVHETKGYLTTMRHSVCCDELALQVKGSPLKTFSEKCGLVQLTFKGSHHPTEGKRQRREHQKWEQMVGGVPERYHFENSWKNVPKFCVLVEACPTFNTNKENTNKFNEEKPSHCKMEHW